MKQTCQIESTSFSAECMLTTGTKTKGEKSTLQQNKTTKKKQSKANTSVLGMCIKQMKEDKAPLRWQEVKLIVTLHCENCQCIILIKGNSVR